ncbi:MAG: hypothetical protein RL012_278 [Bacteroidota bacterium]|jgi:hypothetical protein
MGLVNYSYTAWYYAFMNRRALHFGWNCFWSISIVLTIKLASQQYEKMLLGYEP